MTRADLTALLEKVEAARFWSKVQRRSHDDCWPWLGYRKKRHRTGRQEYGVFYLSKTVKIGAHRASYYLLTGVFPAYGQCIMHTCDNPPCCNPAHLRLGTWADNNRDRHDKGRTVMPPNDARRISKTPRGSQHGCSKLSEADVRAIRADGRPIAELGRLYGVHQGTISKIRCGKTWRALAQEDGQ